MKKILIVLTTAYVPYGGLTTVMMNYYRSMNKSDLKIDFASTNKADRVLVEELQENHSTYYCLGNRKRNLLKYIRNLQKLIKKNNYDVVHINGNSATMLLELSIAKKCGVKIRIAHGHTTKTSHPVLHKVLEKFFHQSYTQAIAVSPRTGDWLFGPSNYFLLNNAIQIDRYRFRESVRAEYRNKLGIDDKFVVGHVGKMYAPKNHTYLLKVFAALKKQMKNTALLLVGNGHLEEDLIKECKELGIQNEVIFCGMKTDPEHYMQAMDFFVFPSLWEGMPLAMIEAQAAGLPCIVSSNVTKAVKCTDRVFFKDLKDGPESWAAMIAEKSMCVYDRTAVIKELRSNGFDIERESEKLRLLYLTGGV